jgi:hypothetical protein
MPSEDDASPEATPAAVPPPPPPPPPPALGTEAPSARRRRQRSWSAPSSPTRAPEFERPLTEREWSRDRPATPPPPPAPSTSSPSPTTTSSTLPTTAPTRPPIGADVVAAVAELKAEVAGLRGQLQDRDSSRDATLVTGAELAESIDALGTTLGTGLAALLTEHRSLLARDLDAATDRILDEVNQRLRASSTQTVENVEERSRHVTAKAVGDLSSALELRLDQLEADLSGLRAVMLEIPDQTQLVERLDQLSDAVGSGRGRDASSGGPALSAALERAMEEHGERLEALAQEMTSLRRRIALRPDLTTDAGAGDEVVPPPPPGPRPARVAARPAKKAPAKKAPAKKAAKRTSR